MKLKIFLSLILLPSMALSQKNSNSVEVILSIDGKPVLTVQEFEKYLKAANISKKNPLRCAEIQETIYNNFSQNRILKSWIKKKGYDKDPAYKQPKFPVVANEQERLKQELDFLLSFWTPEEAILLTKYPSLQPTDDDIKNYVKKLEDELITRFYASFDVIIVKFPKKARSVEDYEKIDKFAENISQKKGCETKDFFTRYCLDPNVDLKKEVKKVNATFIERKNITFENEKDENLRNELFQPSIDSVAGYLEWPIGTILVPGIAGNDRVIIITDKKLSQTKLPDLETFRKDPRFKKVEDWVTNSIRSGKYYDLRNQVLDQIKQELNVKENQDYVNKIKSECF